MDFLRWIRNFSKRYKNRGFHSEIKKEKQQKYLFRDTPSHMKTKRWGILREKKKVLRPFTSFFQEKISSNLLIFQEENKTLWYIGVTIIALCIYIFLFSPYFQISPSKVLIEAENDGIDINIAYRAIEDIYEQNLFFFDEGLLAMNLKKYQHNIETVSIDRLYPNGLKIIIKSYPILYKTTISWRWEKYWWLSANGVFIPTLEQKLDWLQWFDVIANISEDELLDYKNIVPEEKIIAITKVVEIFKQEWWDIKIGKIRFLAEENEFHISLENGGRLLFSLQDFAINRNEADIYKNLKNQLLTLKTYIEKYRSVLSSDGLIYIDVRIPWKIFVCRVKDICSKNLELIYWNNYH